MMGTGKNSLFSTFSAFITEKHKHLLWSFSIFFAIVFILLSFFVTQETPLSLDVLISSEIQEDQSRILDAAMKSFSWLGTVYVAAIMVSSITLLFLISGYRKEALMMLSTLLSGGVTYVLKIIIDRPRPTKDLIKVIEEARYQSFPSGHVLFYTVFFGSLTIIALTSKVLNLKTKILITISCLSMIVLGAVSRIYLGAHWFTDVIGGFCVGVPFLIISGSVYIGSKNKITVD